MRFRTGLPALALTIILAGTAAAQQSGQMEHGTMHQPAVAGDDRELVQYPEQMKVHTLSNMRDHLLTLQKIQQYLANEQYDEAAEIAEQRLGMSSLEMHGAKEASRFMPAGMQAAGTEMHRNASRFARAATDASVSGDLSAALGALAGVTASCVACHDGYRLQ